jgi:hypothetical protein
MWRPSVELLTSSRQTILPTDTARSFVRRLKSRGHFSRLSEILSRRPQATGMLDSERLQLVGPIGIVGAIFGAELGAHALANWPTSSVLWYLNLEIFRPFQYSLNGLGSAQWLETFSLIPWIAIALLVLLSAGVIGRMRLALAIASNLSFLYSACLVYGSYATHEATASFTLRGLCSPSMVLAGVILMISLLSSAVSHRSYWREIFA